jgi:hypothetical protein
MMENNFLRKLSAVAEILTQEKGPLKLLALVEKYNSPHNQWDMVVASKPLPETMEVLREVIEKTHSVLKKEMLKLSAVILLKENDEFVKLLQKILKQQGNPKVLLDVDILAIEIKEAYIIVSPLEALVSRSASSLTTKTTSVRKRVN